MKREKITERNGGITLVALVVTIVVLLILAGISLNLVLGENGIITRAQQSKNQTAEGKVNTEKAVNALTDEMEDLISKNDNSGNSSNSGSDTGNEGSDEDDDDTDPDWKKLTVKERVDKMTSASTKMKIFSKEVAGTQTDYKIQTGKDSSGEIVYGECDSEEKASCECGHLRDIFEKAEEMNLVKTYTGLEYQTIENDRTLYQMVTATIKEESLVLFDFYALHSEQKPGGVIPMLYSLNYQISPNYKEWFDGWSPTFGNSGDFESIMAWVDGDFVKNGFVGMNVRSSMYPDVPINQVGQVYHAKIEVLSKKNFVKAMKALNLDLSAYEGKCTHPVK